jgi:trehalose 6-phosphate synthase
MECFNWFTAASRSSAAALDPLALLNQFSAFAGDLASSAVRRGLRTKTPRFSHHPWRPPISRLIVISNRVPATADEGDVAVGGLAVALAAALRTYRGIWFGWSGNTVARFNGHLSIQRGNITAATVDLEEQDVQEYYHGYANKTLWPLFHYRIDLTAYERSFGSGYDRVNARFAETLRPLLEPDDILWVHDYHLIPLARELRKCGVKNRIGYFLHIPWPARQLFVTLPRHRELVEALFDYDLVGFHTDEWLDAFEGYVRREIGGTISAEGHACALGKKTRVGVFPIGIDPKAFAAAAAGPAAIASFHRMKESLGGRRMILGVDRLDYSKGLEERFLAYEQCLADNSDLRENIFLLQIATISRDAVEAYQDLRSRLESLSGRINGRFATMDWVPIRYVTASHRRDELAGIYRSAAIGLVTPLRDGMNLVAKEYVAAQDPEDPGVLILSRFAGAAAQMKDALIVNPFSREEVSETIKMGLAMDRTERKRRWEELMHGVITDDVVAWRDSFVEALRGCSPLAVVPAAVSA